MFELLYTTYSGGMLRYATKITKNPVLAYDVVQEAFLKIMRHESTLKNLTPEKIKAYITVTVKHTAYNMLKRDNKFLPIGLESEIDLLVKPDYAEDVLYQIATREQIRQALNKLPETYKDVLTLRYYLELSFKEIAEIMDISANHASAIASYAKKKMRLYIMSEEQENEQ